jgi:ABC-type nitrate/sulfonate/bicarbonate transport system permease component
MYVVLQRSKGLVPLIALLLLWQAVGAERSPYFPRPGSWFTSLHALAASGRLMPALFATLTTCVICLTAATLFGFAIGLAFGRSRIVRRLFAPTLEAFRGLPPPLLVPILVLLIGYTETMKITAVIWVAVWPILFNVASASARTEPLLLDVSRTLHLPRAIHLRSVLIPAVVPELMIGIRVAIPMTIIITLLVEMLTGLPGVGALIVASQRQFRSEEVYGLLSLIGIIGLGLNSAFELLERKILGRWPPLHE